MALSCPTLRVASIGDTSVQAPRSVLAFAVVAH